MPLGARALPSWRSPRLMQTDSHGFDGFRRLIFLWILLSNCIAKSSWSLTHQHPRVWPGLLCNYLPICVLWDSTLICFTEGLSLPFPKFWHLIIWQNNTKMFWRQLWRPARIHLLLSFCHPVMLPVRPQQFRRQTPTCKWQYVVHRRLHKCLRGHDPRSTKSVTSHHRINHHVGPGLPIPQEIWRTVQRIETKTVNILQAQMDEIAIGNANI